MAGRIEARLKELGIELPENFRSPYLATSLRDFWRRWHITLSTWLRDYLFIPLGGSRGGAAWGSSTSMTGIAPTYSGLR